MPFSSFTKYPRLAFLARLGSREIWLIAALCVASGLILGFGMLAEEVLEGDTARFDARVMAAFRAAGDPALFDPIGPVWLEEAARDVTSLGSFAFLGLVTAATACYLLLVRKHALALMIVIAAVGGALISTGLKIGFDRPRPDLPHLARVFTASFPSGHATLSAVVFLTLGALLARAEEKRRVKGFFVGLAVFLTVAVGLSRIYLGVHFPSDVLAGWCLGAAWATLCWAGAAWLRVGNGE